MAAVWQSFIGQALKDRGILAQNGVEFCVYEDDKQKVRVRWGVEYTDAHGGKETFWGKRGKAVPVAFSEIETEAKALFAAEQANPTLSLNDKLAKLEARITFLEAKNRVNV